MTEADTVPYVGRHRMPEEHSMAGLFESGFYAVAEESLFLRLAKQQVQQRGAIAVHADEVPDHYIADIKARLGDRLPRLSVHVEDVVVRAFAGRRGSLPRSHPRYGGNDKQHDHTEGEDGNCTKRHGPVQRLLEAIERRTIGRVKNPKTKLILALGFRGLLLGMCPGDDLAAIGLQTYGAVYGYVDAGAHDEQLAILPKKPYIECATLPREARAAADNEARWQRWVTAKASGPAMHPLTQWARRTGAGPVARTID